MSVKQASQHMSKRQNIQKQSVEWSKLPQKWEQRRPPAGKEDDMGSKLQARRSRSEYIEDHDTQRVESEKAGKSKEEDDIDIEEEVRTEQDKDNGAEVMGGEIDSERGRSPVRRIAKARGRKGWSIATTRTHRGAVTKSKTQCKDKDCNQKIRTTECTSNQRSEIKEASPEGRRCHPSDGRQTTGWLDDRSRAVTTSYAKEEMNGNEKELDDRLHHSRERNQ
ncbi:hypothetical protein PF005_g12071 [Phytophthora fragariae]|uniref:Uncharacterized protein n=1 Tax=Phytophthora fragariae TaxID=53985 RepID=A0A6A3KPN1_9STRA|nr:hypothetical protein PF009_g11678 [Phytophthora fragariae]KAE9007358.1 hypothetical protein PF011_g11152 [Phytophthora fragariae]KAE9109139.1 hypothetical protein PF010_g11652 [Phytophthora fragariae]KAE9113705.1 hypothetical protein PF007_g10638 [Phytophthora fragariae]KAE9208789.1 hypothetical protein PF005_g12071 [Phytophthora fragariae]